MREFKKGDVFTFEEGVTGTCHGEMIVDRIAHDWIYPVGDTKYDSYHIDDVELVSEKSSEPEESNIQVSSSVTVTILKHEYILTKEEARELSEKLIKELS